MAGETPRVGDYVEPAGGVSFAALPHRGWRVDGASLHV